jgi:uncharacterized protein (UPF0332 family)
VTEELEAMIDRAHRAIGAAGVLLAEGFRNSAASEAYYAMFHAASAALASIGQGYSKHSAVISAFGREFAKTGLLPRSLHSQIRAAFETRRKATYDYEVSIPQVQAEDVIAEAEEFVAAIEQYLERETQ